MTAETNSAEKLYTILDQLFKVPGNNNLNTVQALTKYFEEEEINSEFGYSLSAFFKAFEDVREDIQNCVQISDRSKNVYTEAVQRLSQVLQPVRFTNNWQHTKDNFLKPADIDQLHTLSDFLDQHRSIKMVAEDDINSIRADAEILRDKIEAFDGMNNELRILILHQLNELIKAISLYKIFGDTLFQSKAKEIFGDVFSNPIYKQSDKPDEELKGYFDLLEKCRRKIKSTNEIAGDMHSIATNIDSLSKLLFGS